jgi:hypothetical protein
MQRFTGFACHKKELMARLFCLLLILIAGLITACPKGAARDMEGPALNGRWIREGDLPGREPADTLVFFTENGKDLLAFYFSATAGAIYPSEVKTEYKFENSKLALKDFTGGTNDFIPVESFQWTIPNKEFSVKLYQIVHLMSADYRVTYRKIN